MTNKKNILISFWILQEENQKMEILMVQKSMLHFST